MISRLRRKFIVVVMSAVVIVLLVIMASINIASFYQINAHAKELIQVLTENGGEFPKLDKHPDKNTEKLPPKNMSAEVPDETRYFKVLLGKMGCCGQEKW